MKSAQERGELGAWLVEQRRLLSLRRGRKVLQRDVVEELAKMGHPIEASYYRALEGGSKRQAGQELRERLSQYFGAPAPTGKMAAPSEDRDLVTAIHAQTAALSELARSVRLLVAAQLAGDEAEVREEVARLVLGGRRAGEQPVPQPGTHPLIRSMRSLSAGSGRWVITHSGGRRKSRQDRTFVPIGLGMLDTEMRPGARPGQEVGSDPSDPVGGPPGGLLNEWWRNG